MKTTKKRPKDRMSVDGPMTCKSASCRAFRKKDPAFAKRMQRVGIVAHYIGPNGIGLGPGDYWMLDGITPVNRKGIEELLVDREEGMEAEKEFKKYPNPFESACFVVAELRRRVKRMERAMLQTKPDR